MGADGWRAPARSNARIDWCVAADGSPTPSTRADVSESPGRSALALLRQLCRVLSRAAGGVVDGVDAETCRVNRSVCRHTRLHGPHRRGLVDQRAALRGYQDVSARAVDE